MNNCHNITRRPVLAALCLVRHSKVWHWPRPAPQSPPSSPVCCNTPNTPVLTLSSPVARQPGSLSGNTWMLSKPPGWQVSPGPEGDMTVNIGETCDEYERAAVSALLSAVIYIPTHDAHPSQWVYIVKVVMHQLRGGNLATIGCHLRPPCHQENK